jgi:glutamate-ammonia-ligase adenylyltransferase
MTPDLIDCLVSADDARDLFQAWGVRDPERGRRNLGHLAATLGPDDLRELAGPLGRLLPRSPDPDRSLNSLERFLAQPDAPALPVLLDPRARLLDVLIPLFGVSQSLGDLLCVNPDFLDVLRLPPRRTPDAAELAAQLQADVDAAPDAASVLRAFRRFRQRHLLRVGANDIVRDRPLEEVTRDLARVADAALEVALAVAWRQVAARLGAPCDAAGRPVSCCVLAFGKLGGEELNYSSDLDLMFVYGDDGQTRGRRGGAGNDEFFARVVGELVRLLSEHTDQGQAYRIDLRLRPDGGRGPLARSLASTLSYYDTTGRTWERQALIKVRPAAGDPDLGRRFLEAVEPFVYRKYLSFAEINEIKAIKRRIERQAAPAGDGGREVKTGRGGIRDIEFTLQFLQLLNGGDLPELRQRNTLLALQALEAAGCLTDQEYRVLDDSYRFLRKTEHRLQLLFDLQTHRLPDGDDELRLLARRMGYPGREPFLADYHDKTEPTRRILDHLLHQTFAGDPGEAEPESDLLLDTAPGPDVVRAVLGKYPFRDVQAAYQNLSQLAQESVPFLSTRRCRHFLASIAPGLLRAVAETPDPDMALLNLEKVTASLGCKTVLWELFSFNPPSLKLYVDLCASSQFLSEILISNPGMIDELLDSLVLNQPRGLDELRDELAELCRNAADLEPILHSFQDKELLRIGVRDILGKSAIRDTTAELSDLAEVVLRQTASAQAAPLQRRLGVPLLDEGPRAGRPCRCALLALGKLGGREMNYHSDLDVVMIYEGGGHTAPGPETESAAGFEPVHNHHFYTDLAQRLIRAAGTAGPMGRLYQIDMRLRPTGKSGSLVVPLAEFRRYFALGGPAQLWERQALTRARPVYGDADFGAEALAAAQEGAYGLEWRPVLADEVLAMRQRLEASRGERDLKRGFGGLVDVEFLVQLFQLKYGRERPEVRAANTWQALDALRAAGLLAEDEHAALRAGYDFLLRVQSRLRIVHNRALDEAPGDPAELDKLARRLGFEAGAGETTGRRFLAELERHTRRTRELFLRLLESERAGTPPA